MLRSRQMLLELDKLGIGGLNRREIELGLQGEVVQFGTHFEALEFDESAQTSKEMVALGSLGTRRGLFQRGVLLEGFVIDFDAPPFLEELLDVVRGERQVARYQIAQTRRAVIVCEDLFEQEDGKRYVFEPNFTGHVCG